MKAPTIEDKNETARLDEGLRQKLEGLVPEVARRLFYAGLGAVFTTEEGMRKIATDFSLPKDMARYLIQSAQSTKDELFQIVAAELRGFLEGLNLNEELLRLLTSLSFEIKTEVRFIPNEQKVLKPQIKNKVAVRRKASEETPETPDERQEEQAAPENPSSGGA
jgi:hypothetical protein